MSNSNIISQIIHAGMKPAGEPKSDVKTKLHRTSIEELSVAGYELSEEHLRLVTGGMRSSGTCCNPGMCDDD